ncbi:hypothetical protein Tco_0332790 [Tanacetum coccineum]
MLMKDAISLMGKSKSAFRLATNKMYRPPSEPSCQEEFEHIMMNFIYDQEERIRQLENYMQDITDEFMEFYSEVALRAMSKRARSTRGHASSSHNETMEEKVRKFRLFDNEDHQMNYNTLAGRSVHSGDIMDWEFLSNKVLARWGVIMELNEGECCWPATRGVAGEGRGDDEEGDGERGNDGIGGSADIYRSMSQGEWQTVETASRLTCDAVTTTPVTGSQQTLTVSNAQVLLENIGDNVQLKCMAPVQLSTGPAPMFLMPGQIKPPRVKRPVSPALAVSVPVNSTAGSTIIEDNPFAPVDIDPFVNEFNPETSFEASSSGDVSSAKSTHVSQTHHHLGKWSKDHPLNNAIGNPSRPCMTRSSTNELYTPYKDPEHEFQSSRRHFKTLSLDELRSPDFNLLSDEEYSKEEEEE